MNPSPPSFAYQMGQIIGALLVLFMFLVLVGGFALSLWKAIRTRRKGWIISSVIFSLPFFAILILFLVGVGIGIIQGISNARNGGINAGRLQVGPKSLFSGKPTRRKEAYDLINDPAQKLEGVNFNYSIKVPALSDWKVEGNVRGFDRIIAYNDLSVAVIAEHIGMTSLENLRELVIRNLTEKSKETTVGEPTKITINGRQWMVFDMRGALENFIIQYRVYIYTDESCCIQIFAWTSPALFVPNKPLIEK
ncbi:MAG: hypothetical protein ABI615_14210, partial [Chthoniobacterales bacterium]